jgi:hypothetical protein
MVIDLEELARRVDKIEKQKSQEALTLIEILSNATFFGEINKSDCIHAKNDQCTYFVIRSAERNTIPIVTKCRVRKCAEESEHSHIEISNITCSFCQVTKSEK